MKFGTVLGGLAAAAALACAGSAAAQVTTMFADNFDGATTTASGVTVARTGGGAVFSAAGTFGTASNNFFENRSVSPIVATLWTLSNLPSHDSVTLDFDALFVNTWDSSNGSNSQLVISPDYYDVYLDDVRVLRMTARIASGTVDDFGGGALQYVGVIPGTIVAYVASPTPITIAHSASTFALRVEASRQLAHRRRMAGWRGRKLGPRQPQHLGQPHAAGRGSGTLRLGLDDPRLRRGRRGSASAQGRGRLGSIPSRRPTGTSSNR